MQSTATGSMRATRKAIAAWTTHTVFVHVEIAGHIEARYSGYSDSAGGYSTNEPNRPHLSNASTTRTRSQSSSSLALSWFTAQ